MLSGIFRTLQCDCKETTTFFNFSLGFTIFQKVSVNLLSYYFFQQSDSFFDFSKSFRKVPFKFHFPKKIDDDIKSCQIHISIATITIILNNGQQHYPREGL